MSAVPPWDLPPPAPPTAPVRAMPVGSVKIRFEGDTRASEIVLTKDAILAMTDATLNGIISEQLAAVRRA